MCVRNLDTTEVVNKLPKGKVVPGFGEIRPEILKILDVY